MAKFFRRQPWLVLGLSQSQYYADIAAGKLKLTQIKVGERATAVDDDELLRVQLEKIADANELTGAEREAWLDSAFIEHKAQDQRVAEHRERTEKKPRGMHAKRLAQAQP